MATNEWGQETDKKFQAWPRTAGPPVVMNPIRRQNFIVKSEKCNQNAERTSYVDRFLSKRTAPADEQKLCLLGATLPRPSSSRPRPAIDIVGALDYRLGCPTAYTFVGHFTRYYGPAGDSQELEVQQLAYYLADQSLLYYGLLHYLPSVVAASAIFLARLQVLSPPPPHAMMQPWSEELK
ncbi:hypothetical protein ABZP36_022213 [Zizania latifolia]